MEEGWVDVSEVTIIDRAEARILTDRIKDRAEELWHLLLEAYERDAHGALGYKSWGEYFRAEFGGSKSRAYELIDAGRVVRAIEAHSGIPERPNAGQADELAPLAKAKPEEAAAVWDAVVQEHGSDVTAADVREAVAKKAEENRTIQTLPADFVEILQDLEHAGCKRVINDDNERNRLWKIYTNSGPEEAREIASIIAGDDKPEIHSVFAAEKYLKNKHKSEETVSAEEAEKRFFSIQQRLHELAAGIDMAGGLHKIVKKWPEQNQRIFVSEYRVLAERVIRQVEEFEQAERG